MAPMTPVQTLEYKARLAARHDGLIGTGPKRIAPNSTDDAKVGGDEDERPLNEMLQSIASHRHRDDAAALARLTSTRGIG